MRLIISPTRRCGPFLAAVFATAACAAPPLPDEPAIEKAKKLVVDVYRAEIAEGKAQDTVKLLVAAASKADNDAARAATLLTAADVAKRAGDIRLACRVADEIQRFFDFDALDAKASLIKAAAQHLRTAESKILLVNCAMEVIDDALAARRIDEADAVAKVGQSSAARSRDPDLRKAMADKKREVDRARSEYMKGEKELAAARATLKGKPNDGNANRTIGLHFAEIGDWESAVKYLARCDDQIVRNAARLDAAGTVDAKQQGALGDAWWEIADGAHAGKPRLAYHSRAVFWYTRAVPGLKGLELEKVKRRIAEAGETLAAAASHQSGKDGGKLIDIHLSSSVSLRLVRVGGTEDGTLNDYLLAQTELSAAQWCALMGGTPDHANLPKRDLSYDDVEEFLSALNALPTRYRFRIPNAGEFRHAIARGNGASTAASSWAKENSDDKPHSVGTSTPNALGLYDLTGNCWEWCDEDILIGGAWDTPLNDLRSVPVLSGRRGKRWVTFGCRIAAEPK